jgi:hypothetical protein
MAKLIAKYEFDYDYHCDDDYEDNFDYDTNHDYYYTDYSKMLSKFLDNNENLKEVHYICVNTRYTHRIIEMYNENDKINMIQPAVIFTDKEWNPQLAPKIIDNNTYEIVKDVCKFDSCVFNAKDSVDVFDCISDLGSLDYCGFCKISSLQNIMWYDVNGKTVMIAYVDTESG